MDKIISIINQIIDNLDKNAATINSQIKECNFNESYLKNLIIMVKEQDLSRNVDVSLFDDKLRLNEEEKNDFAFVKYVITQKLFISYPEQSQVLNATQKLLIRIDMMLFKENDKKSELNKCLQDVYKQKREVVAYLSKVKKLDDKKPLDDETIEFIKSIVYRQGEYSEDLYIELLGILKTNQKSIKESLESGIRPLVESKVEEPTSTKTKASPILKKPLTHDNVSISDILDIANPPEHKRTEYVRSKNVGYVPSYSYVEQQYFQSLASLTPEVQRYVERINLLARKIYEEIDQFDYEKYNYERKDREYVCKFIKAFLISKCINNRTIEDGNEYIDNLYNYSSFFKIEADNAILRLYKIYDALAVATTKDTAQDTLNYYMQNYDTTFGKYEFDQAEEERQNEIDKDDHHKGTTQSEYEFKTTSDGRKYRIRKKDESQEEPDNNITTPQIGIN